MDTVYFYYIIVYNRLLLMIIFYIDQYLILTAIFQTMRLVQLLPPEVPNYLLVLLYVFSA